ncbi:zinc transport system ATP-binding protein [Desulfatibacillum alkenivorans DSM 16219]|jgi:zinc transport system ATP-binding protein|uniref:Zinc transport system ATP-binding protein n=1 Tax=Desulfatibacillum alkenivorans DSM 16219 TaxID=1121393 RepID=A0A1M6E708_9BACT|nr:ABC transporter ATP-binding protein [Desulfatibacillum alkenivorans]SHI81277.1 zinc transport system ATP-binding protein [Desulfatibacillum alkenivorans DSM 16219]
MSIDYDIELDGVTFGYTRQPVLNNVRLQVEKGEFASIVGPNGGGKTTLLKLMLGLLKPDAGSITMLGTTPEKARLKIGYMPQYSHLDPQFPVTVMDVVLMGRMRKGAMLWHSKKDRDAAMECLEEVQLSPMAHHMYSALSGGQKQRVLIARALACKPELLLLDEPTSNVDPEVQQSLFDMLQKLNEKMTILLVSHDLGFVSQVVKSVICVSRELVVHPTSELNGTLIKEIYGGDCRLVRHDHRCSEGGHCHD